MIGLAHVHRLKKLSRKNKKKKFLLERIVDDGAYFMGAVAVAANVPQLWNIWVRHETSGVSALSWSGFLLGSIFWFSYGILHKEKPITVINGALILIQSVILLGLIVPR